MKINIPPSGTKQHTAVGENVHTSATKSDRTRPNIERSKGHHGNHGKDKGQSSLVNSKLQGPGAGETLPKDPKGRGKSIILPNG